MLQPESMPCPHCPWRRDIRPTLTGQQILALRDSCGARGDEAGLTAPMIACVLGDQQRPCVAWLAAHGAEHLGVRFLVATGQLPSGALKPQPGWPACYANLQELAEAHTATSLADLAGGEVEPEPDLDVHDPATGRARLMKELCSTCILKPGDLMHLGPDYLRQFLAHARARGSFVICHQTLPGMSEPPLPPAICRGFANSYDTPALQIAASRGFDEIPAPATPTTGQPRTRQDAA
ncbi:DUF6283 family protein [Hamadaea sp. NPDC050747]|uniref:DUF6283 family protein n=1 Tax=Hamadaea sp. NPDC050747 TaxID=3155789 RepID=UPI0033ED9CB9